MAKIFGTRWVASYGESDDGTWLKGLRGLTPHDIANGLSACIDRALDWPPTLPQFRAMCRPPKPARIHQTYKSLSAPEPYSRKSIAVAKAAIRKTPKALRGTLTRILDNCVKRYSK